MSRTGLWGLICNYPNGGKHVTPRWLYQVLAPTAPSCQHLQIHQEAKIPQEISSNVGQGHIC